jgi:hypothetical protein
MLAHSIELRASLVQTFKSLHRIHRLVGAVLDGHSVFFADVVFGGVILLFQKVSDLFHEHEHKSIPENGETISRKNCRYREGKEI